MPCCVYTDSCAVNKCDACKRQLHELTQIACDLWRNAKSSDTVWALPEATQTWGREHDERPDKVRQAALSKLTALERAVLGLPSPEGQI